MLQMMNECDRSSIDIVFDKLISMSQAYSKIGT